LVENGRLPLVDFDPSLTHDPRSTSQQQNKSIDLPKNIFG